MLNFKKWMLAVLLVTGSVVAAPRMASASGFFFCNVQLVTGASQFGSSGYISASLYTGNGCTGSFAASGFICSSGSTVSECSSSGFGMRFTMDQLVAMFAAMHDAELGSEKVFYSFPSPSPNQIFSSIQFMAPGYPF